jgi:hypothetical protein
MLQHYSAVRSAATAIANAAETAVRGLNEGRVQGEEAFTDRMIGAIEERLRGGVSTERLAGQSVDKIAHAESDIYVANRSPSITWSAMTLTSHKRSAQETEFGADFLGALEIELSDYRVKKGFLSQAKLVEPKKGMSSGEFSRLQSQCEKMLAHTPAAYVFLYSRKGIRVASALSVVAVTDKRNPYDLYTRSIERFFEEHFQSFLGDQRINSANLKTLELLRAEYNARTGFLLRAAEQ